MFDTYLSLPQEKRELQVRKNAEESPAQTQSVSFSNNPKVFNITSTQTKKTELKRNPIIKHNFRHAHPLLRFVTKETVAFLFKIEVEQIYRIECWQHVVYVHAEGVNNMLPAFDAINLFDFNLK